MKFPTYRHNPTAVDTIQAQTEKQNKFMQHLEKIFTETDTTYIAPNKYNLTFMVEQSFWHERYRLGTRIKRRKTKHQFCTYSNS